MAGLLDKIQEKIGCIYLSDLRGHVNKEELLNMLNAVTETPYSIEEWSSACSYIFRRSLQFSSYRELREYLSKTD